MRKILYIPDLISKRDVRYLDTLKRYADEQSWEGLERFFKPYLIGTELDRCRFSSFWILPNGKLYPVCEGCHQHTAKLFMDEFLETVYSEDSLSEYAVRYADWLKLRLPGKGITSAQESTICSLTDHHDYKLMMSMLFPIPKGRV